MPNNKVYFGTLDDMQWVPAPQANSTYNKVSWRASGTFLNGGGYQRQSGTSHKELSLAWSVQQLEMIDKVLAQFNKGEMLYYIDPIAAKYNVLPPYVAQYQPDNPQGVDFVDTGGAGALGYPRKAAVYRGTNTLATVPVPAGQNLWVGAHGDAMGNSSVTVAGDGSGTPEVLSTRTNLVPNPRGKYTSGTVEVRRNIFPDPRGTNATGWSAELGDVSSITDFPGDIATAQRHTRTSGGTAAFRRLIPTLAASTTYAVRLKVRASAVTAGFSLNLRPNVGAPTAQTTVVSDQTLQIGVTEFTASVTTSDTAPSNTGFAAIWSGGTTGDTIDMTAVLISPSTVMIDYFDGSYSPDPDLTPSWTGTANESASVLLGHTSSGWRPDSTYNSDQSSVCCFKKNTFVDVRTNGAKWFAASFDFRGASGLQLMGNIRLEQQTTPWDNSKLLGPEGIVLDGQWHHYVVSCLVPVAEEWTRFIFFNLVADNTKYLVTNVLASVAETQAEALAAVATFFDGDSANTQDGLITTNYVWNGTPGAASSTETVTYNPNAAISVPITSTSDSQRANTKIQGGQNLTISTTGTGLVQLNGLIAQVLPAGETPTPGGFISGQGHSGLRLNGDPLVTQYSVSIPNAQIGVSAEFIETGAWE